MRMFIVKRIAQMLRVKIISDKEFKEAKSHVSGVRFQCVVHGRPLVSFLFKVEQKF